MRFTLPLLLLLSTAALADEPFVGDERLFRPAARPAALTIAASSTETILVWTEGTRVMARVGDTVRQLGSGADPDVASDGRDFLIVWQEADRVAGVKWSDPASQLVFVRFPSTATYGPPHVVWDGRQFLVRAATEAVTTAAAIKGTLFGVTYSSQGPYYACIPVGMTPWCGMQPAYYRVNWTINGVVPQLHVFGIQQTGFASPYAPGAAADDDQFLMAWKSDVQIEGRRIGLDGAVKSYFTIPAARPISGLRGPQLAFDGTRHLVVFDNVTASGDILGAFVDDKTYAARTFVIAGSGAQERAPALAAAGPDRFVVAYVKDDDTIATRRVSFSEPPLPSRRRAAR